MVGGGVTQRPVFFSVNEPKKTGGAASAKSHCLAKTFCTSRKQNTRRKQNTKTKGQ